MFNKNIWILASVQPLVMATAPMVILISGLLAHKIAPSPALATLPLALMIVATAIGSAPAAMIMKLIGRKSGFIIALGLFLLGHGLGYLSATKESFNLLVASSMLFGLGASFIQQFRFAVIDNCSDPKQAGSALSFLLLFNLLSAFIGTEAGAQGEYLFESRFAGSFLIQASFIVLALIIMFFYTDVKPTTSSNQSAERSIWTIIKQPVFLVAVSAAGFSFAIMSYIMTATPIAMHEMHGFSTHQTKWVIQSHIIAMFLPSLLTAWLFKVVGLNKIMVAGALVYILMLIVALSGVQFIHYWVSLVLLGLGWNFLFVTGTALLPQSYQEGEKFKVQATNDVIVFGLQAVASLSAGWLLFNLSWQILLWSSLPMILLTLLVSIAWTIKNRKQTL